MPTYPCDSVRLVPNVACHMMGESLGCCADGASCSCDQLIWRHYRDQYAKSYLYPAHLESVQL